MESAFRQLAHDALLRVRGGVAFIAMSPSRTKTATKSRGGSRKTPPGKVAKKPAATVKKPRQPTSAPAAGLEQLVTVLEAAVAASSPGEQAARRFVAGAPVRTAELAAAEARLGFALPPSLKTFVQKYGCFRLGEANNRYFYLDVWPTAGWRRAVDYYAGHLGCAADVAAVAKAIGMDAAACEGLAQTVVIGSGEDQDLLAFDLRTRSPSGECAFLRMRLDDSEIDAVTKRKTGVVDGRGLDRWLLEVATKKWRR